MDQKIAGWLFDGNSTGALPTKGCHNRYFLGGRAGECASWFAGVCLSASPHLHCFRSKQNPTANLLCHEEFAVLYPHDPNTEEVWCPLNYLQLHIPLKGTFVGLATVAVRCSLHFTNGSNGIHLTAWGFAVHSFHDRDTQGCS